MLKLFYKPETPAGTQEDIMSNATVTVKLDRCGFCGARRSDACREFGQEVVSHDERFVTLPDLFIEELDGLTAPTAELAYEWAEQAAQYEAEAYAEGVWLRAAENNEVYRWESEQDELRARAFGF